MQGIIRSNIKHIKYLMSIDDFDKRFPINILTNIDSLIIFNNTFQSRVNSNGGTFNDICGIDCLVDFQKWNDYTRLVGS